MNNDTYTFFATVSRMKYIERWALMRNSRAENLSEHSCEVAMIAHVLCTIGNVRYGHKLDANLAALIGLYHDTTEIITGHHFGDHRHQKVPLRLSGMSGRHPHTQAVVTILAFPRVISALAMTPGMRTISSFLRS